MCRRSGNPVESTGVVIRRLTLRAFGRVGEYTATLSTGLNHLATDHPLDVVAAVGVLLGGVAPPEAVGADTYLAAQIEVEGEPLQVQARSSRHQPHWLMLSVTDEAGQDVTRRYRQAVRLCGLQERAQRFDGDDDTVAGWLCHYRRYEESPHKAMGTHLVNTNFFQGRLWRYLRCFEPVRFDIERDLWVALDRRGRMVPVDRQGTQVSLAPAEQWSFRCACFFCVTAFWDGVAGECNLHHPKRPLLLYRLWEHLTDTQRHAVADTLRQQGRQILLLE